MGQRDKVALMLHELSMGPTSIAALHELTGLAESSVRLWLQAMRAGPVRTVRIAGWQGWRVPLFAMGSGPDAKRPPAQTEAQRSKKVRKRRRLERISRALTGGNLPSTSTIGNMVEP